MKKIFTYILFATLLMAGCVNLDIPPKNIVSDDDLMGSQSGLQVYLARLYSQMPWEDFKYIAQRGFDGNSWLGCLGVEGTGEGSSGPPVNVWSDAATTASAMLAKVTVSVPSS